MSINKMCCNWSYTASYYIHILRHNLVIAVTAEIVQGKEKYQIKALCMLWHVFENPKEKSHHWSLRFQTKVHFFCSLVKPIFHPTKTFKIVSQQCIFNWADWTECWYARLDLRCPCNIYLEQLWVIWKWQCCRLRCDRQAQAVEEIVAGQWCNRHICAAQGTSGGWRWRLNMWKFYKIDLLDGWYGHCFLATASTALTRLCHFRMKNQFSVVCWFSCKQVPGFTYTQIQ